MARRYRLLARPARSVDELRRPRISPAGDLDVIYPSGPASSRVQLLDRRDVRHAHPTPVTFLVGHDPCINELLLFLRPVRVLLHAPNPGPGDHPRHACVVRDADDRLFQVVPLFEADATFTEIRNPGSDLNI
jgi:hypothetical protein